MFQTTNQMIRHVHFELENHLHGILSNHCHGNDNQKLCFPI